jgi:hypothetical protein
VCDTSAACGLVSRARRKPEGAFSWAAAVPSRFFITFDGPQAHVNSVEKHIHYRSVKPQIPPLRFASVGMTKGRATVPWRVADELSVFHHHGWAAGR